MVIFHSYVSLPEAILIYFDPNQPPNPGQYGCTQLRSSWSRTLDRKVVQHFLCEHRWALRASIGWKTDLVWQGDFSTFLARNTSALARFCWMSLTCSCSSNQATSSGNSAPLRCPKWPDSPASGPPRALDSTWLHRGADYIPLYFVSTPVYG